MRSQVRHALRADRIDWHERRNGIRAVVAKLLCRQDGQSHRRLYPGGYYDIAGRVVARHFGQYIPGNPTVVVQNQPGAAGLASVNKIGNTAERDGRTILVMSRALPQLALVGDPNAAFDPLQLTWLGSLSSYKDDAYLVTVNSSHPAKSLADVRQPASRSISAEPAAARPISSSRSLPATCSS